MAVVYPEPSWTVNISIQMPRLLSHCQGSAQSSHLTKYSEGAKRCLRLSEFESHPLPPAPEPKGQEDGWWVGQGGWSSNLRTPVLLTVQANNHKSQHYQMLTVGQKPSTPSVHYLNVSQSVEDNLKSLVHLFTQRTFVKHLLCARHCAGALSASEIHKKIRPCLRSLISGGTDTF